MLQRLLFLLAVIGLVGSPAHAKPPDATKVEARRHYEAGLAHFNLREYPAAIEEFQAAYRLLPDSVFLYNLAQSYRLSDNAEQALYFYRTYLRNAPDAPNRTECEERIATLEKLIAEKQNAKRPPDQTLAPGDKSSTAAAPATTTTATATAATAPSEPPATTTAAATTTSSSSSSDHVPVYKKWWLWTIVGVVVVGAGVGLGIGLGTKKSATFNANAGTFGPALSVNF